MKIVLLCFLFSLNCFSQTSKEKCPNSIPISEAEKAIAMEPGAGAKRCEDLPNEECLCYDGVIWQAAEIIDNWIDDTEKPLYSEEHGVVECNGREECEKVFSEKSCHQIENEPSRSWMPFIDEKYSRVYCVYIRGFEQRLLGKKIINVPQKVLDYEAAREARKIEVSEKLSRKAQARQTLKDADLSRITTVAGLRTVLIEVIRLLEE